VSRQDPVERAAEPDQPATQRGSLELERAEQVVGNALRAHPQANTRNT
jgi:hypothetical protein